MTGRCVFLHSEKCIVNVGRISSFFAHRTSPAAWTHGHTGAMFSQGPGLPLWLLLLSLALPPSLPAVVMSRPSDCCHFFQFFQISFGFSFLAIISYMLSSSFFDSFTPYLSNPLHCKTPQFRPFLLLVCFYMSSRHCWRQNFTISATGVSAIEDHLVFKVKWASIFLWLWRFQAREKMMLHFSSYRNNNACWSSMTESDGKLS